MALIHHPVLSKNGDVIASAVTNLDLHDIARTSKTYGVGRFYVVTPLEDQAELVRKIIDHWVSGAGAVYNPIRREALLLLRVKASFEEVLADIRRKGAGDPVTVATSAKPRVPGLSFGELKGMLKTGERPVVLALGTAWGLTEAFIGRADYTLEPITGGTAYNHLPVRSAAAIMLDRLLGRG